MRISMLAMLLSVSYFMGWLYGLDYHIHNNSTLTTLTLSFFAIPILFGLYLLLTVNLKKHFSSTVQDAYNINKESQDGKKY